MRRRPLDLDGPENDPLSGMANLFDVAMVFAVALMVAMAARMQIVELFTKDDVTLVKNPGEENMEIIVKKGDVIERYQASGEVSEGGGKRVGSAYQLEDGTIVYVPE
ncbi:MAG: DUF2149 domain-containing protein [Acidobacteriota bacterium]